MKILVVSDEESPALWDYYVPGRLSEYDLIISCGDLNSSYLSFLVTMGRAPLLYVHGNHDTSYEHAPPEGCDCIEDRVINYNGLRILGLGGCLRYHPGAHQYTERQMRRRILKIRWEVFKAGGVDLVVTHAPPRGLGDSNDLPHRGFEAFLDLIDTLNPQYLLHGHVHMSYDRSIQRRHQRNQTTILNCCGRYVLDVEPNAPEGGNFRKILRFFSRKSQSLY